MSARPLDEELEAPARAADPGSVGALAHELERARAARAAVLRSHTSARIIAALGRTAADWRDPGFRPRRRLLDELPVRLRLAPAMLARGLDYIFSAITEAALRALVIAEAGSLERLDPSSPLKNPRSASERSRLLGPPLIYHALSGNVPGLAVPAVVASLLARSVCLLRDSARQPLLTAAFVETLRHHDAELAAMVVASSWTHDGTGAALHRLALDSADRVELYGSDATVTTLAEHASAAAARESSEAAIVVARGTRLSIAVVAEDARVETWAEPLALDVVMYDGLGCLTPHVIVVEADSAAARRFARALASELDRCERQWPRQHRDIDTETQRRAFIDGAELSAAAGGDALVLRDRDDAWCIEVSSDRPLAVGPGLRCVRVATSAGRRDTLAQLRAASAPLAAVALGGHAAGSDYAHAIRRCGATLVCSPGRMQAPPIAWSQDGLARLGSLLGPAK